MTRSTPWEFLADRTAPLIRAVPTHRDLYALAPEGIRILPDVTDDHPGLIETLDAPRPPMPSSGVNRDTIVIRVDGEAIYPSPSYDYWSLPDQVTSIEGGLHYAAARAL